MPVNHLVALRDVTGEQTYLREAEHIDQFELPVSENEIRDWAGQEQEAVAVIAQRESLPEFLYQPDSGFDWEGPTLSLQDGFVRAAFRRLVGKNQSCSGHFLCATASFGIRENVL